MDGPGGALFFLRTRFIDSPTEGNCGTKRSHLSEPGRISALLGGIRMWNVPVSTHVSAPRPAGCPGEEEEEEDITGVVTPTDRWMQFQ